jgi:hypothetical protein
MVQIIKNDILIESNTLRRERLLNIFCGYGNIGFNLSLRLARNRNKHADEDGKHQYKHLFQSGRDSSVGDIPEIKSVHVGHLVYVVNDSKVANSHPLCQPKQG